MASPPVAADVEGVPPDVARSALAIRITIVGARGLRGADWKGRSNPFVQCQVVGLDVVAFQTEVKEETLEPEWNEEFEIADYDWDRRPALRFDVLDCDSVTNDVVTADKLGHVELAQFAEAGFDGELKLLDSMNDAAHLKLRVVVSSAQGVPKASVNKKLRPVVLATKLVAKSPTSKEPGPSREDLERLWQRYDVDNRGIIGSSLLRGLLADLARAEDDEAPWRSPGAKLRLEEPPEPLLRRACELFGVSAEGSKLTREDFIARFPEFWRSRRDLTLQGRVNDDDGDGISGKASTGSISSLAVMKKMSLRNTGDGAGNASNTGGYGSPLRQGSRRWSHRSRGDTQTYTDAASTVFDVPPASQKAGSSKSNIAWVQAASTCICGNVFAPDSNFCRKCGVKRPLNEVEAGTPSALAVDCNQSLTFQAGEMLQALVPLELLKDADARSPIVARVPAFAWLELLQPPGGAAPWTLKVRSGSGKVGWIQSREVDGFLRIGPLRPQLDLRARSEAYRRITGADLAGECVAAQHLAAEEATALWRTEASLAEEKRLVRELHFGNRDLAVEHLAADVENRLRGTFMNELLEAKALREEARNSADEVAEVRRRLVREEDEIRAEFHGAAFQRREEKRLCEEWDLKLRGSVPEELKRRLAEEAGYDRATAAALRAAAAAEVDEARKEAVQAREFYDSMLRDRRSITAWSGIASDLRAEVRSLHQKMEEEEMACRQAYDDRDRLRREVRELSRMTWAQAERPPG